MAATAIFLVAILAIGGLLMQGFKAMDRAGGRSVAHHSTQQEIEAVIQELEANEEVIVNEEYPYWMEFGEFGISVKGRLITVTKISPGLPEGKVVYKTFVPDEIGGED